LALGNKYKLLEENPGIVHFILELNKIYRFFNFAPLLNHLFGLGYEIGTEINNFVMPKIKLTKNMKEILYALVKYPEATTTELAKKIRVTRGTVANNKNLLIKEGFMQKAVIPNTKKLNCELSILSHYKFNQIITDKKLKEAQCAKKRPLVVLKIAGNKEGVSIRFYKDYSEHEEGFKQGFNFYKKKGIFLEEPTIVRLLLQKTKTFRIDFAGLTKKMLGIKEDI
jgi:hypothetical protein